MAFYVSLVFVSVRVINVIVCRTTKQKQITGKQHKATCFIMTVAKITTHPLQDLRPNATTGVCNSSYLYKSSTQTVKTQFCTIPTVVVPHVSEKQNNTEHMQQLPCYRLTEKKLLVALVVRELVPLRRQVDFASVQFQVSFLVGHAHGATGLELTGTLFLKRNTTLCNHRLDLNNTACQQLGQLDKQVYPDRYTLNIKPDWKQVIVDRTKHLPWSMTARKWNT